jgi:hypothetical protein
MSPIHNQTADQRPRFRAPVDPKPLRGLSPKSSAARNSPKRRQGNLNRTKSACFPRRFDTVAVANDASTAPSLIAHDQRQTHCNQRHSRLCHGLEDTHRGHRSPVRSHHRRR